MVRRRQAHRAGLLRRGVKAPNPFARVRWRSPIRGPWLTSVFGLVLLIGIPIEFITGLLSYAAYDPRLGHNNPTPTTGSLHFYLFNWLTEPQWLFRVTEGFHVVLGLALTPVLLAKLWSVIPKLFTWPPLRSVAQMLERLSLVLIVGGAVFQFATGIMDIDYDYSFKFSFYEGHFLGAWILMGGFAIHVSLKLPTMVRSLRRRRLRDELATPLAGTRPEDVESELVSTAPAAATISRRGALALVGGSSVAIIVLTIGESVGGTLRRAALLAPRGRSYGSGPNDFQVNKTAATARITAAETGPSWRLSIEGASNATLARDELLAMPLLSVSMPIACVEGWSTVQHWSGVRLTDLARKAGVDRPTGAYVESLQRGGAYSTVTLAANQVLAGHSMLALRVNGVDLSLDHGYPARLMIPDAPGVHNTKWVRSIHFFS